MNTKEYNYVALKQWQPSISSQRLLYLSFKMNDATSQFPIKSQFSLKNFYMNVDSFDATIL